MKTALAQAHQALLEGEVPVGAVIVMNGTVIGKGHNKKEQKQDITSHAEIEAIKEASKAMGSYILDSCTIFVTLEPCLMCASAIRDSRIFRVVFGTKDEQEGAVLGPHHLFDSPSNKTRPLISFGVLENECRAIIDKFFAGKRHD